MCSARSHLRAAHTAWTASGGPSTDASTSHLEEAHALQLTLLALQHEIGRRTGAAAGMVTADAVDQLHGEEEEEDDDDSSPSLQFDCTQPPPSGDGGFRWLQHDFLGRAAVAQLRAAATLGMAQCFRRGGQTTLSITPELVERLAGCGAASAVPCLADVMQRMLSAAKQRAAADELHFCGALLVRLVPPCDAAAAAPACWPLPARQPYWSAHVDRHNVPFYDVSCLLYLSDAGVDFEGGDFAFHDDDADRVVPPRAGTLLVFSSGAENPHSVGRVSRGVRFALAAWFTRDARRRAELPPARPAADGSGGGAGGAAWALGGAEAALLSAATHSLASNDPLRERLLTAHARGASLFSEMRAAQREAGGGGGGGDGSEGEGACDPAAVLAWAERLRAAPASNADDADSPLHVPPSGGATPPDVLEALRRAVQSRAAVCDELLARERLAADDDHAGGVKRPLCAPVAAHDSCFDVFD